MWKRTIKEGNLISHPISHHTIPHHNIYIIHKRMNKKRSRRKLKRFKNSAFQPVIIVYFTYAMARSIEHGHFFYVSWEMEYKFHVFLMATSFIKLCTTIPDREQIATIFFIFNCIIILRKTLRWERSMLVKFVRKWAVLFKSFIQSFIIKNCQGIVLIFERGSLKNIFL